MNDDGRDLHYPFGIYAHNELYPEHGGRYLHYCAEYDGIAICEDCSEWDTCMCFRPMVIEEASNYFGE